MDAILYRILEGSTKERRIAAKQNRGNMFRWNGQVQTFRVEDLPADDDEETPSTETVTQFR